MSDASIDARITTARSDLEDTLDQLDEKFNVPKQVDRLRGKAMASYESHPVPWIIGATAAAIVVAGTVAWAILSDD